MSKIFNIKVFGATLVVVLSVASYFIFFNTTYFNYVIVVKEEVNGLRKGSDVLITGMRVGSVKSVKRGFEGPEEVLVFFNSKEKLDPLYYSVHLNNHGFTAEKFLKIKRNQNPIDVSALSKIDGVEQLKSDPSIAALGSSLLEDLNKQYHSEDVQSIIKDARSILAKFSEEYDNIKPQIRTITSLTSKLLLESLAIANNIKNALDDISPIIREEAKELKGCSKELISKTNKQYNELVTYIDQHKEQLDKLINHTTKTYSNFQKSKFAWLIGLSEPAQDEDVDS